jgi:hypothetical protein
MVALRLTFALTFSKESGPIFLGLRPSNFAYWGVLQQGPLGTFLGWFAC